MIGLKTNYCYINVANLRIDKKQKKSSTKIIL